jgi:2-keto-4-pentenoate hydratase/2-oxohepta-3-ene-1,7-dioic acid hydratase in catechol pathway
VILLQRDRYCAELIHFSSINFTLRPGMMIITGTPAGTAWSVDQELGGAGNRSKA